MNIAIIGAGLAGLTAAYELREHTVTVLEADGRIGGKLFTVPFQGGPVDMGAQTCVRTPEVTDFFAELGLSGCVEPAAGSGVYDFGQPGAEFLAFRGGFAQLYEALAEKSGADIYLDKFVSGVTPSPQGFKVSGAEGTFDRVLFATPAPTTARLLSTVAPQAAKELKSIKLESCVAVGFNFGLAQDPAGNQLPESPVIPAAGTVRFILSSNRLPHLAQREGFLVHAIIQDDLLLRAEEDDLVDLALDELKKATGFDGRAAGVEEIYTQRWFGGLPRQSVEVALGDVRGIGVAGAWVQGAGVPDVIAQARAAARGLLA